MKKIVILFIIILSTNTYAYFEYNDYSTKAASLGGAAVSRLEGSDAVFYNPALLTQLDNLHCGFNYHNLYPDVINNEIYSYNFSVSKYIYNGSVGAGYYSFVSDNYAERMILLGYGYDFSSLSAGLNLKYGGVDFSKGVKDDPLIENAGLSFFSFDLGALYIFQQTKIGLSILNLYANEQGLEEKTAPQRKINLGASQKIYKMFIVAGELSYLDNYINYKAGIDILLIQKILEVNLGFNKQRVSFGLSTTYENFSFDYTGEYNLVFTELNFSQMIGLRFVI